MDLKDHIRAVPDFPIPDILFYDISTLLADAEAWQVALGRMAKIVSKYQPDMLAGIESRGFLVAAPLASRLGLGFTMVRKKGKLPGKTVAHEYALEYGTDTIEIQDDCVKPGQRVVILDDLLATGGRLRHRLICSTRSAPKSSARHASLNSPSWADAKNWMSLSMRLPPMTNEPS